MNEILQRNERNLCFFIFDKQRLIAKKNQDNVDAGRYKLKQSGACEVSNVLISVVTSRDTAEIVSHCPTHSDHTKANRNRGFVFAMTLAVDQMCSFVKKGN